MTDRRSLLPILLTALVPVLWSTGGVALRAVSAEPWRILFWRSLFMTLTVVVLMAAGATKGVGRRAPRERPGRRDPRHVIVGAVVGVLIGASLALYVMSMTRTSVASSLLVQAAAPLFIVTLGWIVIGEPVRIITVLALVLVGIGIGIIVVPSVTAGGLDGNLYGLGKAATFATATILIRRYRSLGLVPAAAIGGATATIAAALAAPGLMVSPNDLAILAAMGVFQTGVPFVLYASYSGQVRSTVTGLLVLLEAVLGPLWVWLIFAEVPSPFTLIGGTLILIILGAHTVLMARRREIGQRASPARSALRRSIFAPSKR